MYGRVSEFRFLGEDAFDPVGAQLAVFSDGNHHMALAECIETCVRRSLGLHDVFYTTTPPSVYLTLLKAGELSLGNLTLRVRPNVVIGPSDVVGRLHAEGEAGRPVPFARSRGNAFLVRRGNPKAIGGVSDLVRGDVVPFMSNPDTEAASYAVYRDTIRETARLRGLDVPLVGAPAVRGEWCHCVRRAHPPSRGAAGRGGGGVTVGGGVPSW